MANDFKWSELGTTTTIINGDGTSPTLKNLADEAEVLSDEIANATDRNQYADFELLAETESAAFDDGAYVELFFVQKFDGTNYEDGSSSVDPQATQRFGIFNLAANTNSQRKVLRHILLPATDFKVLLRNKSGETLKNTDDANHLKMRTYNQSIE